MKVLLTSIILFCIGCTTIPDSILMNTWMTGNMVCLANGGMDLKNSDADNHYIWDEENVYTSHITCKDGSIAHIKCYMDNETQEKMDQLMKEMDK